MARKPEPLTPGVHEKRAFPYKVIQNCAVSSAYKEVLEKAEFWTAVSVTQ